MAVTRAKTDSHADSSDSADYTHTAMAIGTANAARLVFVGCGAESLGTTTVLNSATIGGVSATIAKQQRNVSAIDIHSAIIWALVPSGTTGDVVLHYNTSQLRSAIAVYNVMGANTTTPVSNSYSDSTASDNPQTVSATIPAGGAGIAFAFADASSSTTTAGGLDEDVDTTVETVTYFASSKEFASLQSGLTVSATFSGSVGRATMCVVAIQAGTTAYTLTAAVGAFVFSGIAAVLNKGKTLTAAAGSFVFTGVAAALRAARKLTAGVGTFVLTGIAAVLNKGKTLLASVGTFTFTGIAAFLRKGVIVTASAGAFVLTGVATLKKISRYSAKGTFVLTGVAASLRKGLSLTAAKATFVFTGIAAVLARAIVPASKTKLRLEAFVLRKVRSTAAVLRKTRQTPPTLGD